MEKKIWWLVVAGLLVVVVVVLWKILSSPAVGKISYESKSSVATPTPMEYIRFDGQKISFAYENKYDLRAIGTTDNPEVDNWELVGNSTVSSRVVITYRKASSGNVDDVSGVKMRQIKNEDYEEKTTDWNGIEGKEFLLKSGGEWVDFFVKDGYSLTVAYSLNSSDFSKAELELKKIVDSIRIVGRSDAGQ